jgi:thiamine biosynthesis lipoprotein
MGTAISLDVTDGTMSATALERAFDWLRDVDARFSTYRADSEVSRLARGEIALAGCSADFQEVLAQCEEMRVRTEGFFDIRRHRTDGRLDPSGFVKGWALDRAAAILVDGGARSFCLNGGGDVIAKGEAEPGRPWRIGIRHPRIADRVAGVLELRDLAVATSGSYERGDHVTNPHSGRPPRDTLSVTVVGRSLTETDVLATAALAMDGDGIRWLARQAGYCGCAITSDDRLISTPEFQRLLAR